MAADTAKMIEMQKLMQIVILEHDSMASEGHELMKSPKEGSWKWKSDIERIMGLF